MKIHGWVSRRILTVLTIFALVITHQPSFSSQLPLSGKAAIEKWAGTDVKAWGLQISDTTDPASTARYLMVNNKTVHLCNGDDDPLCHDKANLYQKLSFDRCIANSRLSCIGGVWAIDAKGRRIDGQFIRPVTLDEIRHVSEDEARNLPASTSLGGIWRLPGVINSAGTDAYYVNTQVTMFKPAEKKAFEYGEINSRISAVREIRGDYSPMVLSPTGGGDSGARTTPDGEICVSVEFEVCHAPANFPENHRFGMSLRVGEKLSGWFHGRLSAPLIEVKDWQKGQEILIEGEPVNVPTLDFVVPREELSAPLQKLIQDCVDGTCGSTGNGNIVQTGGNVSHPTTMKLVTEFSGTYLDRASRTQSVWSFKNMFNHAGAIDQRVFQDCSTQGGLLTGLVLTNALTYSSGPPVFDRDDGTLNYQVASPHYEEDGDLALGSYDLTIRSTVARCLYGFSEAPIKAEITIIGDDGGKRVSTTVVNEKNGWLYLSAKGFTYSSPTIKIKLAQDASRVPTNDANASSSQSSSNKFSPRNSITCVKGTKSKKIVAIKPKCPKGFKRA